MNPFNPSDITSIQVARARNAAITSDRLRLLSYNDDIATSSPERCRDFWIASTDCLVAEASDVTEYRMSDIVQTLRCNLVGGVAPAECLKVFHWKVLELGPAELAFRFQRMWAQTLPHLRVPTSGASLGRMVINLRALESACHHGNGGWARQIMIDHFDRIMPLDSPNEPTSVS